MFSLSLDFPDSPTWLRTLTFPQEFVDGENGNPMDNVIHINQLNGLAVLPNQPNWLDSLARNVLLVTSRDTKGDNLIGVGQAQDRLMLVQDPE